MKTQIRQRLSPLFLLSVLGVLGVLAVRLPAQQLKLPPVTRTKLSNGVQVILMEYRRAPSLTVVAVFPGGNVSDPADKVGTASIMTDLLRKGTEKRTATQIAEEIDFLGGSLGAGSDDERLTVSLNLLAKDTDAGLDLFADVIRHPTFPAEELERTRSLQVAELQAIGEDPGTVASRVMGETVYAGHPYGAHPTITSIKAIGRDDILASYRRNLAPDRMILVAVGDFQTPAMLAKLKAKFEDWPDSKMAPPDVPAVGAKTPKIVLIDKPDATQTQVRLVRPAIARNSPDYFPAVLASTILGGGFTSRLVDEIRVNRSLTYGIGSRFGTDVHGGDFSVSTFTKIETTRALLDATRTVLKQSSQGLSESELKKVKGFLAGQFAIGVQTPQALAGQLANIAFFGLPEDYLQTYIDKMRAVPLVDVNRVARTYFAPESLSIVLVAPAEKVKAQLNGLGAIETRSIDTIGK